MARHRKDYQGEPLTASLNLKLTPSDRAGIAAAAAEQGITDSEFARALILNGLRAYRTGEGMRQAHRKAVVATIEQLTEAGDHLNVVTKLANRAKFIEREDTVAAVCLRIGSLLEAVPTRIVAQPKDPHNRKLVAELAAIGNNVRQLRRVAKSRLQLGPAASLAKVDQQLAKTMEKVLPA